MMNQTVYCYNSFVGRLILNRSQAISIAVCLLLQVPMIIATNGALIFALYKTNQLNSIANKLTLILSISDFLYGLVCVPSQAVLFAAFSSVRVCWYELATIFTSQLNGHFSAYIVITFSLQRYFKANPSLRSQTSMFAVAVVSKTGTTVLVAVDLLLSIGHGLVTTYFFNTTRSKIPNYLLMSINFGALLVVYLLYIRLYCRVRSHAGTTKHIRVAQAGQNNTNNGQANTRYYKDFTKTISIILVSFAICLVPYIIMDFLTGYYSFVKKAPSPQKIRFLYYLSFLPLYFFSAVNAIIILYRNKVASRYIKQRFTSVVTPSTQSI